MTWRRAAESEPDPVWNQTRDVTLKSLKSDRKIQEHFLPPNHQTLKTQQKQTFQKYKHVLLMFLFDFCRTFFLEL